jgi:hypothetical protein
VALVLPFLYSPATLLAPIAAVLIGAEMLLFCALHIASGDKSHGPLIYWLVVAAICALIAYVSLALPPL